MWEVLTDWAFSLIIANQVTAKYVRVSREQLEPRSTVVFTVHIV